MHLDPLIPPIVGIVLVVLLLGLILQYFRQPQLVGYIITGIVIGPAGLGILTDIPLVDAQRIIGF